MSKNIGALIASGLCFLVAIVSIVLVSNGGPEGLALPIIWGIVGGSVLGVGGYVGIQEDNRLNRENNEREYRRGYEEAKATAASIVELSSGAGYQNIAQELARCGSSSLKVVVNTGQGKHYTRGAEQFMKDVQSETKKLKTKKVMTVEF